MATPRLMLPYGLGALLFMKTRNAIVWCVMLVAGVFAGHAQESVHYSPFVLAVTNVSITSVRVVTNNAVSFLFANADVVNVDELDQELAKSGIHSTRLVRVMDGMHVVAEGRLLGRAWGTHANGFLLRFDTGEAAQDAAKAMRDKGTLVFPKRLDNDSKR
jgi:hypothetical protein